jgi:hypothetical protein
MKLLMMTWTDLFNWIGDFFYWIFSGMRALGQGPNILMGSAVIILLAYWTIKIMQQNKKAEQDGTYK